MTASTEWGSRLTPRSIREEVRWERKCPIIRSHEMYSDVTGNVKCAYQETTGYKCATGCVFTDTTKGAPKS